MLRFIVYGFLATILLATLPLSGEVRVSNKLGEIMYLRGSTLAVTFPWKGTLIKDSVPEHLLEEVLLHEQCHVDQIDRIGWFDFIVEYQVWPEKFENECYNN